MRRRKKTEVLRVKQIKEVLRLRYEIGLSQSEVARSCGLARSTVQDYLRRAEVAGVSKEELLSLSEQALEELFAKKRHRSTSKQEPDYEYLQRELCKKGVTRALLWQEYITENPKGYGYASFCSAYREWKKANRISMRQQHKAGEKLYVDFAGQKVSIYNKLNGEVSFEAEIFVAVLGASNYTYAEATPSQEIRHWLAAHSRAFEYLEGVPSVAVPDNLKSGVKSASYYDPIINPAYHGFAKHYGIAVLPTRVRKPKDKSKVEVGVQIVERWIIAALRKRRFFSIEELNEAILPLLEKVNNKKMISYGCSRKELFESVDKPALKPLPEKPYKLFDVKLARVNIDYHVEIDSHYYSVPYKLIHKEVEIRIAEKIVEIFFKGKRVSIHPRSNNKFHHSTKREHMPPSHKAMLEWTPERLLNWASKIGPETNSQVQSLLNAREHPEQGFRACLGLLRQSKEYGNERLEAACKRANQMGIVSMRSIKSMLKTGMDRVPVVKIKEVPAVRHHNLRGGEYYQ